MRRDPTAPLAALLFTVLALPSAGVVDLPLIPTTGSGLLALYGALASVLLLTTVGRAAARDERGGGWRVLTLALSLLPFFVYALEAIPRTAPGGIRPSLALPVIALGLALFAAAGRRVALVATITGTALLLSSVVLASAGTPTWPRDWNPLQTPLATTPSEIVRPPPREGVRVGAAVPLDPDATPLGIGAGPFWVPATVSSAPRPAPLALIVDGAPDGRDLVKDERVSLVHESEVDVRHPLDLDGFDAVAVLSDAWSDADPARARRLSRAIAGFVRRGGLLVGPSPTHRWPTGLARRLGAAGRTERSGPGGLKLLGMGRVVRAADGTEMQALLASELWVRDVRTAFDRASTSPPPPAQLTGVGDPREGRGSGVLLLVLFLVTLTLFSRVLRGAAPRALGIAALVLATAAGIGAVANEDPGFRARGVLIELGGAGGRRIDAIRIEAGPEGYAGRVQFAGSGLVRVLGAEMDAEGRVLVAPDSGAWVVREGLGAGRTPDEVDDRHAGWVLPLLRGKVDPKRVRYGRVSSLPARVEGAGPVAAVVLRYRGG